MASLNQFNQEIPPLKSPTNFAWILGFPINDIKKIAKDAERSYDHFISKKGRPIDNPLGDLKAIQRKINDKILTKYPYPHFIIGGVKKKTIKDHLEMHVKQPVVVTLDVRKCFPSISNEMVYGVWRKTLGCYPDTARLATQLTTFHGHLPLGASTSTLLAALVLLPCLEKVRVIIERHGFCHTQFVDDAALSGKELKDDLIAEVCKEFSRHGLPIKRDKVRVMRSNSPQIVTKMSVNHKMGRPRAERNKIRTALKELELIDPKSSQFEEKYISVRGRINYLKPFHPQVTKNFLQRLETTRLR